ncbi:MAG: putative SOS response-associated peptidase YoaM [Lysobacteraceae bacterium]|nr:MAG: putative SOS response-associated peptidase YoaM [Xanthomonadaceae bacterium]
MCGRYFVHSLPEEVMDHFDLKNMPQFDVSFNIAPSHNAPVITGDGDQRRCRSMRWGLLPRWAKDERFGYKTINARIETLTEKPAFKRAARKRRALIPANGFYEWSRHGGEKLAWAITSKDDAPMAFAGLWETWGEDAIDTFTIVTTQPNALVSPIHDRMPVILQPRDYATWLAGDTADAMALGVPCQDSDLEAYTVDSRVGKPEQNDADLLAPKRQGQLELGF